MPWIMHWRSVDGQLFKSSAAKCGPSIRAQVEFLGNTNSPSPLITEIMVARAQADPANWEWDIDQDGEPYILVEEVGAH